MIKHIRAVAATWVLMLAAGLTSRAAQMYIDFDVDFQQMQELRDLKIQQGADVDLRVRPKVGGAWLDLTGYTASFQARATMTATNYYGADSVWTSNSLHQVAILLDSNQTGDAVTNWTYVISLVKGGLTYPVGAGDYTVEESTFSGAGTLLTDTNQWATRAWVLGQGYATTASDGDITAVAVEGGLLTGGGTNGAVTIGLSTNAVRDAVAGVGYLTNSAAFEPAGAVTTLSNLLGTAAFAATGDFDAAGSAAAVSNALGELAFEDWPATDGQEYVAKDGAWAVATGGGGDGTYDHAGLSNLTWTASGHTGTAGWLAGFFEGGVAGYSGPGAGLYFDGSDLLAVSNDIISGAAAGATALQAESDPIWAASSNSVLSHVASTSNPHGVTAAQAGAVATNDAGYTQTVALAASALPKSGGTMTGGLSLGANSLTDGYIGQGMKLGDDLNLNGQSLTNGYLGRGMMLGDPLNLNGQSLTNGYLGEDMKLNNPLNLNGQSLTNGQLGAGMALGTDFNLNGHSLTNGYLGQGMALGTDFNMNNYSLTNGYLGEDMKLGNDFNMYSYSLTNGYLGEGMMLGNDFNLNTYAITNGTIGAGVTGPWITNLFSGAGTTGLVSSAPGDAGKYLKADGTWDTPAGGSEYDDSWTNGMTSAAWGDWAGITNPPALGTSEATVTNIAKLVAYAPGVESVALVSETTVTVPRTEGVKYYRLTLTNAVTLRIATNSWTATEVGAFSLDIIKGAQTLAFNTADIAGSTVLDINTNANVVTPLYFRKPAGEIQWRVRQ